MSYHKDAAGCDIGRPCSPHSASQDVRERDQQPEDGSLSFIPFDRPTGMSPTDVGFNVSNIQAGKEAPDPAPQSFLGDASSSVSTAVDKSPKNDGLDALMSYFLTQPAPPARRPSSGSFATQPAWGAIDHLGAYHPSSQSHGLPDASGSSSVTAIGRVPLPGVLGSERRWRDDEAPFPPTSSLMGTDGFKVHPYINGPTVPSGEVDYRLYISGQQLGSSQICSKNSLVERHEARSRRTGQSGVTMPSRTAYPRHDTRGSEVQLPRTVGANHDIIARPPAPSPANPRWIAESKIAAQASASTPPPSKPSKKRKRGDREDALEPAQSRAPPSVPLRWRSPQMAPAASSSTRSPASSSRAEEGGSSGGGKSS